MNARYFAIGVIFAVTATAAVELGPLWGMVLGVVLFQFVPGETRG